MYIQKNDIQHENNYLGSFEALNSTHMCVCWATGSRGTSFEKQMSWTKHFPQSQNNQLSPDQCTSVKPEQSDQNSFPSCDITPMLSPWRRSPMVTNGAITEAQRRLVLPPIYKLLHQIPPGPALITPAISSVNSTIWIKWSGLGLGAN